MKAVFEDEQVNAFILKYDFVLQSQLILSRSVTMVSRGQWSTGPRARWGWWVQQSASVTVIMTSGALLPHWVSTLTVCYR